MDHKLIDCIINCELHVIILLNTVAWITYFPLRPLPFWHALAKESYKNYLLATKVTIMLLWRWSTFSVTLIKTCFQSYVCCTFWCETDFHTCYWGHHCQWPQKSSQLVYCNNKSFIDFQGFCSSNNIFQTLQNNVHFNGFHNKSGKKIWGCF